MKEKKNFLDYVPCCNPLYTWDVDKKGIVTVDVVHKGFYPFLAQKLFKRPRVSHIKLDEYGSFIWQQMDGSKTIYDIAELVKEQYGEAAEPLLDRLVEYFRILYQNKFIGYVKTNS